MTTSLLQDMQHLASFLSRHLELGLCIHLHLVTACLLSFSNLLLSACQPFQSLLVQAIGLSRKQMADRGIRQAVDSVRNQTPTQSTQRPPAKAAPSNPSRAANSISSSMGNSMGRPHQGGSLQPPSRPHVPSSGHRAGVTQAQGQRQTAPAVGQMPAWMQKAKQAGTALIHHHGHRLQDHVLSGQCKQELMTALRLQRLDSRAVDT